MVSELKNWCVSKLQRMEARLTADAHGAPLRRSSSLDGGDIRCLVTSDPTERWEGGATGEEDMLDNHYFVVQMDSSSGRLHTHCSSYSPWWTYYCQNSEYFELNGIEKVNRIASF